MLTMDQIVNVILVTWVLTKYTQHHKQPWTADQVGWVKSGLLAQPSTLFALSQIKFNLF